MRYGQVGRIFSSRRPEPGCCRFEAQLIDAVRVGRAAWRRRAFQGRVGVSDPGRLGSEAHRPAGCGGRGPTVRAEVAGSFRQSRGRPPGLASFAVCACWNGTYVSWIPRVWRSEIRVSILGVFLSRGRPPGSQMTEPADLKMPGALEAVDGVLAQVDSGAVTAGEAIELVLNARIAQRNHGARSLPGQPAGVRRLASCLVSRRPLSSVRRRWRW